MLDRWTHPQLTAPDAIRAGILHVMALTANKEAGGQAADRFTGDILHFLQENPDKLTLLGLDQRQWDVVQLAVNNRERLRATNTHHRIRGVNDQVIREYKIAGMENASYPNIASLWLVHGPQAPRLVVDQGTGLERETYTFLGLPKKTPFTRQEVLDAIGVGPDGEVSQDGSGFGRGFEVYTRQMGGGTTKQRFFRMGHLSGFLTGRSFEVYGSKNDNKVAILSPERSRTLFQLGRPLAAAF